MGERGNWKTDEHFRFFFIYKANNNYSFRMMIKNSYRKTPFCNVSYQDLFIDLITVRYPVKKLTNVFEVKENNNN